GFSRAMRSNAARVSSTGERSLLATRRAASAMLKVVRSSMMALLWTKQSEDDGPVERWLIIGICKDEDNCLDNDWYWRGSGLPRAHGGGVSAMRCEISGGASPIWKA